MELKPVVTAALFVCLASFMALTAADGQCENTTCQGVWQGRIETVTAAGAMLSTAEGSFWTSNASLAPQALRGDSLLVLGMRHGRFITPFSTRLKPSGTIISRVRRECRGIIQNRITDPAARGLTAGLTLGLRGMIPAEVSSLFKSTGTSHLLALSGLHTVLVALMITALLRVITGRRPVTFIAAALFTILFVLLSGYRPSTVRAGIMAVSGLLWTGFHGGRIHGLSVWWIALLISTALWPGVVHDRGAQLSFGAVLSLILLGRAYRGRFGFILSPVHAGIAVTVGLMPLLIHVYGGIVPAGPLATVLSLVPMIAVMVLGTLVSAGVSILQPVLSAVSSAWIWILRLLSSEPAAISGGVLWALWVPSVIMLRIWSGWNGFHRRFR